MAYSVSNPPAMISQGIGGFFRLWIYKSTDAATVVRVANYISNGWSLGMRAGDLVLSVKTDASPISMQMHLVTTATAAGVNLSDGTASPAATNTD